MSQFKLEYSPGPSENDVERGCCDYLRVRNYCPIRLHSGLFRTMDGRVQRIGEPGLPDWVVLHATRPAFLMEVKRPGKLASEAQKKTIFKFTRGYGLDVIVVDSPTTLRRWLEERDGAR